MTDVAKTATASAIGLNDVNHKWFRIDLGTDTLASGYTLTVTLPGMAGDLFLPLAILALVPDSGAAGARVWTVDADIGAVTTYTEATGVLVITATGNVAAATIIHVLMLGNQ